MYRYVATMTNYNVTSCVTVAVIPISLYEGVQQDVPGRRHDYVWTAFPLCTKRHPSLTIMILANMTTSTCLTQFIYPIISKVTFFILLIQNYDINMNNKNIGKDNSKLHTTVFTAWLRRSLLPKLSVSFLLSTLILQNTLLLIMVYQVKYVSYCIAEVVSQPQNLRLTELTSSTATVCWLRPAQGVVTGYVVTFVDRQTTATRSQVRRTRPFLLKIIVHNHYNNIDITCFFPNVLLSYYTMVNRKDVWRLYPIWNHEGIIMKIASLIS